MSHVITASKLQTRHHSNWRSANLSIVCQSGGKSLVGGSGINCTVRTWTTGKFTDGGAAACCADGTVMCMVLSGLSAPSGCFYDYDVSLSLTI